ncbi:MAG TPA: hypothetical protein VIH47_02670 [Solirubrobacterales bacterium]
MPPDEAGTEGFVAYAAAHGLTMEPEGRLPRSTPLLAEGELRSVEALMRGWLGTYLEAQIAIVSRDETTTGADGAETKGEAHFTVAVAHLPKAKRFVPWLLCHRVEDGHLLGRAAEQLIHGNDRIDLESAELDRSYRIFASPERDEVWLRELFSPSFIVFLLDRAPTGFAFEYVDGTLCVSQVGRLTLGDDIDGLRDSTVELVARIRAEISERLGHEQGRSGSSGWKA